MQMRISERGIAFIKTWEGLELEAYLDIVGRPTIGYGHTATVTSEDVANGRTITEAEADSLLRKDVEMREVLLNHWLADHGLTMTQNEFDATISWIYNLGWNAFHARSTFAKRILGRDRVGAADAMTWWNKGTVTGVFREITGLTRRRAAEKALFLEPPVQTSNRPGARDFADDELTAAIPPIDETPPAPASVTVLPQAEPVNLFSRILNALRRFF